MWAFGLVNCGNYGIVVPLGNNGAQKLRNKTLRGWKSETATMQKCVDEVYVLTDSVTSSTWFKNNTERPGLGNSSPLLFAQKPSVR